MYDNKPAHPEIPVNYVPFAWFFLLLLSLLVFTRHKGTVAIASRTASSVMLSGVSSASSSSLQSLLRLCSVGPPAHPRDHMNFCTRCRGNTLANLTLAQATNRWPLYPGRLDREVYREQATSSTAQTGHTRLLILYSDLSATT